MRGLLSTVEESNHVFGLAAEPTIKLESTLCVGSGHFKVVLENVDDTFVDGCVDGKQILQSHAEGGHDEIIVEVIEEEGALHEYAGHFLSCRNLAQETFLH